MKEKKRRENRKEAEEQGGARRGEKRAEKERRKVEDGRCGFSIRRVPRLCQKKKEKKKVIFS